MHILDGLKVAAGVKANVKKDIQTKIAEGSLAPSLAVLLVGDLEASAVYVQQKMKACKEVGIVSQTIQLPASISLANLKRVIESCNQDAKINAMLVQLPLPKSLVWQEVVSWIDPLKDADSLSPENQGLTYLAVPRVLPCTPAGIMRLLQYYNISLKGKEAVVIGRSHIVGFPMARLLLQANATVTVCHSQTKNLSDKTRRADIVIVAAGQPGLLGQGDFKESATIIDVGIHRVQNNKSIKLAGDVRIDELKNTNVSISPVPGGVGPMTVAMLLANTFQLTYGEQIE